MFIYLWIYMLIIHVYVRMCYIYIYIYIYTHTYTYTYTYILCAVACPSGFDSESIGTRVGSGVAKVLGFSDSWGAKALGSSDSWRAKVLGFSDSWRAKVPLREKVNLGFRIRHKEKSRACDPFLVIWSAEFYRTLTGNDKRRKQKV